MRSETDTRTELRTWVRARAKNDDLSDGTPLFAERHLRSVHLPELLLLLERLRGEPIDVEDLSPGDFRDIDTIVERFLRHGSTS